MPVSSSYDSFGVSSPFVAAMFSDLVERVGPAFFRRNGHVFDEEGVALTEALAALTHLHQQGKLPPRRTIEEAAADARRLFCHRLLWRIKKLAPRWRETTSLAELSESGYEPPDRQTRHQPEKTVLLGDTIRRIERALQAEGWSAEEIDLYFDYKLGELTPEEYAKELDVGVDAAKQRASRAGKKLRERLGNVAEALLGHWRLWLSRRVSSIVRRFRAAKAGQECL
jgi:DNA-directed RNA polymerase specialized sigma24 family protein